MARSRLVAFQVMGEVVHPMVNHSRLRHMADLETWINENHFDRVHEQLTIKVWMNAYIKSPFLRPSDAPG